MTRLYRITNRFLLDSGAVLATTGYYDRGDASLLYTPDPAAPKLWHATRACVAGRRGAGGED